MGVAVGVGDGVAVGVGDDIAVGAGVFAGSCATVVAASMEGGGNVGTAVAKPVGIKVGSGGSDAAVSNPQPVNTNMPIIMPSHMVTNFLIAPNCTKTVPVW